MKNLFIIVCSIILLCTLGFGWKKMKYPLPHKKLTPVELCGKSICDPGNVGTLLHLTKSPYSPALKNKKVTSLEDVAIQVIGRTLPYDRVTNSKDFSYCSFSSTNPFSKKDISNVRFPSGFNIEYKESKTLKINVKTAANANVEELFKLSSDTNKIEKLRVKIEAAYQKVKGKELTVEGRYSEFELNQDVREQIKKNDGYKGCRKWLEDQKQRMILSVGVVYFDISYESKSVDDLANSIDAELKKEGIQGSLSYSFKKEITKRLSNNGEVYQIVIFRHAGITNGSFSWS